MRMKIGTRVRLYFACVIAIVLGLGAFGFSSMSRMARELQGSLADGFDTAAQMSELHLIARQARLVLASSAGSGATTQLPAVEQLSRRFALRLGEIEPRLPPSVKADEMSARMTAAVSTGRAFVQANAQQQWARAGALGPQFERAAADLDELLEAAQLAQRNWVEARLQAASSDLRRRALGFGGGIAACLALALLLTVSLQRRLIAPLGTLQVATARIVEHGDLTQSIAVRGGDEIGDLAASFQRLVEKLRRIPISLRDATDVLTHSVSALTVTSSEQSQAILRQATALQETQVTANEIRQTSAMAAQKAEQIMEVVRRADEVSRVGESSVARSLSGLSEIGSSVASVGEKIDHLKERMRQIDGINLTVKDLADQSNMLALNAAIEAVRSGEHGKGFAVVAREIRSLADQSIQATARVREILQDIARSIEDAAKMSASGRKRMELGLAEVRSSGETMQVLSAMVKETSDSVRQIAASVTQQNAGIAQIFGAMNDLGAVMRETTQRLESTGEAVGRLQNVTEQVTGIVRSYRT